MAIKRGSRDTPTQAQEVVPNWLSETKQLDLTVVIPTKNESTNVRELVERIWIACKDQTFEILFVDDSSDDTAAAVRRLVHKFGPLLRVIHRPPEDRSDGLGGAVAVGLAEARGNWVCVMDGDLQHPPEAIPKLLQQARLEATDVVVASRFAPGANNSLGWLRRRASGLLSFSSRLAFPVRLRHVSDPLSGYFLVKRNAVDVDTIRPKGFKILLEILGRSPELSVSEIGFSFGKRVNGNSKASISEALLYIRQLILLRLSVFSHLMRFGFVGLSGLAVNSLALAAFAGGMGVHYLIAAALATQFSTLWNFSLTEAWVFKDRDPGRAWMLRLSVFAIMNNLALLIRGPVLIVLVSAVGLHYLPANLLTLIGLMLIRFVVADTWIWSSLNKSKYQTTSFTYDIHGILSVDSEVRLPELERFRIDSELATPSIRVRIGEIADDSTNGSALQEDTMRFSDGLRSFGFGIQITERSTIDVTASALLRRSPHVLYTNVVEPILRWRFVKEGYALTHAACVSVGEEAILVTAKTDTGKTTTILRILEAQPCEFISDDLLLVRSDGQVLSYPKPLTISRHTVAAVNQPLLSTWERTALFVQSRVHSRSGRIFAKIIAATRLPAATINTIVQWLIPPPKYQIDRLIPGAKLGKRAQLKRMYIIEKAPDEERELTHEETLEVLMSNTEDAFGFPPYREIVRFLQGLGGNDLREPERRIVAEALRDVPTTLIRRASMNWWAYIVSSPIGQSNQAAVSERVTT